MCSVVFAILKNRFSIPALFMHPLSGNWAKIILTDKAPALLLQAGAMPE
jgi:hypothetical protein